MFRRSGVLPPLDGDEQRIFDAVVKPERAPQRDGDVEAERERLRGEIARAEAMLANERFVANAPADSRRRRAREARALPARARCNRRLTGSRRSRRGRPRGSGSNGCRRCSTGSAGPSGASTSMHVVGTKGKSTAARTIAALLRRRGVEAAAYTSPHVSGWAERLETDPAGFERAVARVRAAAEAVGATQFEILTGAALLDFAERGVEVAVLEAGLGGRLDATNVVDAPRRPADERRPRAHRGARRDARGDRHREAGGRRAGCDRRAARRGVRRARRPTTTCVLGGAREAAAAYLGRPVDRRGRGAAARAGSRFAAARFVTARTRPRRPTGCSSACPSRTSTSSSPRSSTTRTRPGSSRASRRRATRWSRRAPRTTGRSALQPRWPSRAEGAVLDGGRDRRSRMRRSLTLVALGRPVLVTGSLYLLADLAEKD